MYMWL